MVAFWLWAELTLLYSFPFCSSETCGKVNDQAAGNGNKYQPMKCMACEEERKKTVDVCGAGEKEWKCEWGRKLAPVWHSSTSLISFYVLSISLRHLSRQEKRGVGKGWRDSERGNKPGKKKGSGLVGRCRAIDLGLTVRRTDVDTDRHVVHYSEPFCLVFTWKAHALSITHLLTHSDTSYRRINHSQQRAKR